MPLTPTQKKNVRAAITDYCQRAEKNQLVWHYSQQRPFNGYGIPPEQPHVSDCSAYAGGLVWDWAMHKNGVYLVSPLGAPHGYGYTGSMLAWLEANGKRVVEANGYLVGDIAIQGHSHGDTVHTTICRKAGSAKTSVWSSNGNENAPAAVTLYYHPAPVVGVWRHPALT